MKKLVFALAAFCALGASAQDKVGTLENVTGAVSVGGKGFVAKAVNGTPLADGNTVLVPSNGKATVVLAKGCSVSLQGSQHLTVNSALSCEQAIASIRHMAAPVQLAQAPLSTPPTGVQPVGGAGVAPPAGLSRTAFTLSALFIPAVAVTSHTAFNNKSSGS